MSIAAISGVGPAITLYSTPSSDPVTADTRSTLTRDQVLNQRPFGCLPDLSDPGVMLGPCPEQHD